MLQRVTALFSKYRNHTLVGLTCSVGIHVFRYQGGDYIAQANEIAKSNETKSLDVWRSVAFGAFGAYAGSVFFGIYGFAYTALQARGVPSLALVFIDYGITSQILYFPQYYMLQEYIRSPTPTWEAAWAECNKNRRDDFAALCTIYMPFSWFNYAFVPPAYRGTFSGCAGLFWAIYLSHSRGERSELEVDSSKLEMLQPASSVVE